MWLSSPQDAERFVFFTRFNTEQEALDIANASQVGLAGVHYNFLIYTLNYDFFIGRIVLSLTTVSHHLIEELFENVVMSK